MKLDSLAVAAVAISLALGAHLVAARPAVAGTEAVAPAAPPGNAAPAPATATATGPQPRIRFASKAENFGTVPHGTVVKRAFEFTNAGPGELRLLDVKTSCGCTAALPSKRSLGPNESASIDVTFDTGKKPPLEKQHYTSTVTVVTNDGAELDGGPGAPPGVTKLSLEGDVVSRYAVSPQNGVFIANMVGAAAAPVTVTVAPVGGAASLEDAKVVAAPLWVEVLARRFVPATRGIELELAIARGAAPGEHGGAIEIATSDKDEPRLIVAARGQVMPRIHPMPVRFGLTLPFENRPITLAGGTQDLVRIVDASVHFEDGKPSPLVVSRPLPAPDHRVGVNLVPDPGEPARLGFGEVVFLLADADCPVVRVPFRGFDPAATKRTTESFAAAHVRVLPVELDMGEAASGLELDTSLIVEALDPKQALQPTDFGGEPRDTFSLRAEPANEAKSLWRVAVHIKVGPPGFLVGAVYLRPRPDAERLRVPFVLHVVPVTEAYPGGVYVADREPHVVRIARGDRKPVKVASVRSSTPSIVAALVPDAGLLEPGAVAVRVAPAPGAPRGPVRGEVEVAVDDPAVPPVVLPVFGELP